MIYNEDNRGKVFYHERKNQIIDFSGLRFGNITPTDMDGSFDIDGKIFIDYEYKLKGVDMPKGQERHILAKQDAFVDAGRKAIFFVCEHNQNDSSQPIDGANSIVRKYYYNKRWWTNIKPLSVKQRTTDFILFAISDMPEKEKQAILKRLNITKQR